MGEHQVCEGKKVMLSGVIHYRVAASLPREEGFFAA